MRDARQQCKYQIVGVYKLASGIQIQQQIKFVSPEKLTVGKERAKKCFFGVCTRRLRAMFYYGNWTFCMFQLRCANCQTSNAVWKFELVIVAALVSLSNRKWSSSVLVVRASNTKLRVHSPRAALQTSFASNIYMNLNNSIIFRFLECVVGCKHACMHILGLMPMKIDTHRLAKLSWAVVRGWRCVFYSPQANRWT